jgi:hypothetical protein
MSKTSSCCETDRGSENDALDVYEINKPGHYIVCGEIIGPYTKEEALNLADKITDAVSCCNQEPCIDPIGCKGKPEKKQRKPDPRRSYSVTSEAASSISAKIIGQAPPQDLISGFIRDGIVSYKDTLSPSGYLKKAWFDAVLRGSRPPFIKDIGASCFFFSKDLDLYVTARLIGVIRKDSGEVTYVGVRTDTDVFGTVTSRTCRLNTVTIDKPIPVKWSLKKLRESVEVIALALAGKVLAGF